MRNSVLAFGIAATIAAPALADVDFVAFGDMPYTKDQVTMMKKLAHDPRLDGAEFSIFYGDTKSGGTRCTFEELSGNKKLIEDMVDVPLFFTPGDNDWTDCDRKGDDELKILDQVLMPLYFAKDMRPEADPRSKPEWNITRQGGQLENARWSAGGVTFATFHIIATGNGRDEIKIGDKAMNYARVDARDAANLTWLAESFRAANEAGSEAFVLAMHTDPTKVPGGLPVCDQTVHTDCDPYKPFLDALAEKAAAFGKPVLVIHGDTSPYCEQKEFLGVPNMQRLNGTGDYVPGVTRVRYADGAFSFTVVGHNRAPEASCPAKGE
ncbi:hypothetical protein [Kordiimonas gwangyangensis]|uniref:hypothetical protein n=1 Tax=Kordiimonas gwangyangensis TaxID=288022 RepID=UPI0003716F4F|nr:hypothetical protein [Kordiimonas gwangyangensis]